MPRAGKPCIRRLPFALEDQLVIGPKLCGTRLAGDKIDKPCGIGELIIAECEDRALRPDIELFNPRKTALLLDRDDLQQMLDLLGQRAEPVDQLRRDPVDFSRIVDMRQPPIKRQADIQILDITVGDQHGGAQIDLRRPVSIRLRFAGRTPFPAAQRRDRFLQHFLIKLEPDFLDMARLFIPEQITRAANIEIMACQAEPRPKRIEGLQHLEPLFGICRNRLFGRQGKIAECPDFRAPDTAAQLIKLRQPEHIRTMHKHGIRGRNIKAGFNDRRTDQHVILTVIKGSHNIVELARRHLSMGNDIFHLRHIFLEIFFRLGQISNTRTDIKALPAAIMFAQDRLAQDNRIERHDESPHRQPVYGRGRNQRHFAYARQRKLQGARDRRCSQGQHMHIGAQLLEPLFMRNAEMLLFIDNYQAEIFEFHILGKQGVGADHDIDLTLCQFLFGLARLFCRNHARQLRNPDGQTGKPFLEATKMLPA